jgi:hypothetical protein
MAKLSCPQNVSSQDKLRDSGEENRATSPSLEDIFKNIEQGDDGLDSISPDNKFDSALSRSSRHMISESSMHSRPQQNLGGEQLIQVDAEQEAPLASSEDSDSPAVRHRHNKSEIVSGPGSDSDDGETSSHGRCKTQRGIRRSASAPCQSNQTPEKKQRCDCPLVDSSRVQKLYQTSGSVDSIGEVPVGIQEHFDNCIWRGEIGVALTTRLNEVEQVQSPALSEDNPEVSDHQPPASSNYSASQRDTNTDPDPETALPECEKITPPISLERHLRILPWIITWIVLFAVFCTVIGQYHTPDSTPSFSVEQQHEAKLQEQHASQWHAFSHIQEYTYTLPWPLKEHLDIMASNVTVGKKTTQPLETHIYGHINETWYEELQAKTILSTTNLEVGLIVIANHTLDLTALCRPVQSLQPPTSSPTPRPQPIRITSRHREDSKAIVFAKNLLTCLWFLPVWLLAQKFVDRSHMAWLADEEARTRLRVAAVVLSFLAAAALGLGTEVAVRQVAENRHSG